MIIKHVVIGIMIITATMIMAANVVSVSSSYAITNSTSNVGVPLSAQIRELITNPFFGPDYSCLFDAYQLHCIPGDQQECPRPQFGQNDDGTCFPTSDCPEGYYGTDEDESGQCYPDSKPCFPGMIRYPERGIASEACGSVEDVCKKYNMSLPESCFVDGRSIVNFPTVDCLTNPDMKRCAWVQGYGCPTDFTLMTSVNFSVSKCIPVNHEKVYEAERERKVFDNNRCAEGYELYTGSYSRIEALNTRENLGTCNKL